MKLECYKVLIANLEEIELIAEAADAAFQKTESNGRTQGNAMTRAALVLLCGYFEGFVRDVAEEYIEILNEGAVQLDTFPEPLFCAVVEELTGALRRESANAVNAVSVFKAAVRPDGIVKMNKKSFSKTNGNPTVDTIEAVFNSLGIPKIIDSLSIRDFAVESTFVKESQVLPKMRDEIHALLSKSLPASANGVLQEIVELIEARWSSKEKRRKVGYVNEIEQLLKKRNRIAHGEGREQITPTELRSFLACISKLTEGLHSMAGQSLQSLVSPGLTQR